MLGHKYVEVQLENPHKFGFKITETRIPSWWSSFKRLYVCDLCRVTILLRCFYTVKSLKISFQVNILLLVITAINWPITRAGHVLEKIILGGVQAGYALQCDLIKRLSTYSPALPVGVVLQLISYWALCHVRQAVWGIPCNLQLSKMPRVCYYKVLRRTHCKGNKYL